MRYFDATGNYDELNLCPVLGRRVFPRFPECEDIEFLLSNARLRQCSPKCQHWRVDAFVG